MGIDPNILCYHTLCEMVKEAGFREVDEFYYKKSDSMQFGYCFVNYFNSIAFEHECRV